MSDRGFTLLELLVGIVVLGFILAGLGGGLRFGLRASETQARIGAGQSGLDATDRLLRQLVESADPGTGQGPATLSGTGGLLSLTAPMPQAAGGGVAEIGLGIDGAGRLLLRWTPHLHATRIGPAPAPQEAELLRGLSGVGFAFWDGSSWAETWSANALPRLVRIRLAFPPGDARRWPDIVAAPLRANRLQAAR